MNDALMRMCEMVEQIFREARQMTESEWLSSEDPVVMLSAITDERFGSQPTYIASDRKLRLFACACVRQVWHLLTDDVVCSHVRGCWVVDLILGKE